MRETWPRPAEIQPLVAAVVARAAAHSARDAVALDPAIVDDMFGALLQGLDGVAKVRGSRTRALLAEVKAEGGPS